jgi:16S rRNA (cytosine1402-N4)-methyltransferase
LKQLEDFLEKFANCLNPLWKCAIITYHSIEDRLVKNKFKILDWPHFKNVTKKVIFPKLSEYENNKASRSAKLRIIIKK